MTIWSVIVINHNDGAHLPICLRSIREHFARVPYEIIVFDNGSIDQSLERLGELSGPDLRVIVAPRNEGTTRSRNRAAAVSRGDCLLFLDVDAAPLSFPPQTVRALLETQPQRLIAPALIFPDDSVQDSVRRFPLPVDKLRRAWGILTRRPAATTDRYPLPATAPLRVDTAMLAAWAMHRSLWLRVGPFDERIFYSPEDIDWCLRLQQAGGNVEYRPELRVRHDAQKLSHQRVISVVNASHLKGLLYLYWKHGYFRERPQNPPA